MHKGLQEYFPQIRTRKEVLKDICMHPDCLKQFELWSQEKKEEFLDFCTGARGVKMVYDSFFKEIMSPEVHPDRLESLLTLLLKRKVIIRQILPNDSVRIADENTLLITDIIVELDDGSLANVEIQKIGYAFPGQRCACYSADLLLRQYKRVKGRRNKKFTYQDIKTVYTIVFFEKSTSEFHAVDEYIHYSKQVFNTGLKLNMLQEYVLIPLDIYKENNHNKTIDHELDAWLTFFSEDSPDRIIELIEKYPAFKEIYEEVYEMCRNIEGVMDMFSEELLELDRNTVQYMIEEQQDQLDAMKKEAEKARKELEDIKKQVEMAAREKEEAARQKEEAARQKEEAAQQKEEAARQKEEAERQKEEAARQKEEAVREREEAERARDEALKTAAMAEAKAAIESKAKAQAEKEVEELRRLVAGLRQDGK
ncbi:MAG: PD-(D/E)XK nuclease family transposase [Muricomes sp.]|uniref:PD-(D/E)XK nuclease family transposase n=1 Tax=Faecalicatena contorta TaxID=39482 RepID=UPI002EA9996C|nr:PD-(D/E)XK nuclease family transposase [Muricomes sp.]